jgi:hypothetical protein
MRDYFTSKKDFDETQARHAAELVTLTKLHKDMKRGLATSKSALEAILAIEEEYNTFENDAMREVLRSIEKFTEEWL